MGENMINMIIKILRERLDRFRREREAARLVTIGKDCAAHIKEPFHSMPHGELLYDEKGLPH